MPEIERPDKTIKLKVIFHTDRLDNPKMAWVNGKVYMVTNKARGIRITKDPAPFNHVDEILPAIMKKLKDQGIELVDRKEGQTVLVDKKKYM